MNSFRSRRLLYWTVWPTEGLLVLIGLVGCRNGNPAIDLLHKSHNAPVPYPTMHHFVAEICTFLSQNGALWYFYKFTVIHQLHGVSNHWQLDSSFNSLFRNGLGWRRALHDTIVHTMDQLNKSHNTPVSYPTMHHSEQKCTYLCSNWCIVGYGIGVMWGLWIRPISPMI